MILKNLVVVLTNKQIRSYTFERYRSNQNVKQSSKQISCMLNPCHMVTMRRNKAKAGTEMKYSSVLAVSTPNRYWM